MALSPLIRKGQEVESTDPPKATTPVTYAQTGHVFPYRGTETHGVDPDYAIQHADPEEADYGTTVAVAIEADKPGPDPVPVYIVAGPDSKTAIKDWDAQRYTVTAGTTRQVIGRDLARTNLKIRNTHATDTVYISRQNNQDISFMYPLVPGSEFTTSATRAVYAYVPGTNDISLGVFWEREVEG